MKRSLTILISTLLLLPTLAMAQPKGPATPKPAGPHAAGPVEPFAHGRGPGHGMGRGHGARGEGGPFLFGQLDQVKLHLKLTDKQVADIEALQVKYMKLQIEVKKQLAVVRLDLRSLLLDPVVDPVKAKALFTREGALQAEKKMLRLQFMLDVEKLLTADQRKQARLHLIRHHQKGRGR